MRIFVTLIVLIAVLVGALALTLPREEIVKLIIFRDFFDVSLPILAFGALIKYLTSCPFKNKCYCNKPNCGVCNPCQCNKPECKVCNKNK